MPSYRTYIPSQPLTLYVEKLWYYEGYDLTHSQERVLPSGMTQIIIDLSVENHIGLLMCGARSQYTVIETTLLSSVMGVCFRRGGAFPFFNLPLIDLQNMDVPLDALWAAQTEAMRECLFAASTVSERFYILEQILLSRLKCNVLPHPAVKYALQTFHNVAKIPTVASITTQIGLSQRYFIQLFSQQVGLTPKLYGRVRRFQYALHSLTRQPVDWSDVVTRCGYFDQAHFIHDFRAFSGLTPTEYLAQRIDSGNHIPLQK